MTTGNAFPARIHQSGGQLVVEMHDVDIAAFRILSSRRPRTALMAASARFRSLKQMLNLGIYATPHPPG